MVKWKFAESEQDGDVWMRNPHELQAFVDFQSSGSGGGEPWQRIMVVTRSWVEQQLKQVAVGPAGPGRIVFASMLVVPDGSPVQLRAFIEAALAAGGVEHFAEPVSSS